MAQIRENTDFWRNRAVLVTGAGGFIGSHLCERLVLEGAKVRALIHYDARAHRSNLEYADPELVRQMEVMAGDICDPFFVNRALSGQDTVFHLAALIAIPYSYRAPQSYLRVNVEGSLNIAEACMRNAVRRLVHTSTSETYGTARYVPIDEAHPLKGQSPYSASKIAADKVVESYVCSFSLPVVTLRPFNTYGPRQSARAVIPTIISQCLDKSQKAIKLGDLRPVRDLNFVLNTVDAYLAVAQAEGCLGETLNCGSGEGISIRDLARLVMEVTQVRKDVLEESERLRPENSEVFQLVASAERLRELTGWNPRIGLKEGLQRTVEFVGAHPELYRPDEYTV